MPTFHFCNKKSIKVIPVRADIVGDTLQVKIPNILLQSTYTIIAYAYLYDGDAAKTIFTVEIPVHSRPKPEDYEYEENIQIEETLATIDSRIDNIIKGLTESNPDTIGYAEIVDARIAKDGTVYNSLKEHIHTIEENLPKNPIDYNDLDNLPCYYKIIEYLNEGSFALQNKLSLPLDENNYMDMYILDVSEEFDYILENASNLFTPIYSGIYSPDKVNLIINGINYPITSCEIESTSNNITLSGAIEELNIGFEIYKMFDEEDGLWSSGDYILISHDMTDETGSTLNYDCFLPIGSQCNLECYSTEEEIKTLDEVFLTRIFLLPTII